MNRTDRLYALTEELRRAGDEGRTAQRLADHFETSARTIKRDMSALQQAGLPVLAQAGPGGGYVLAASASLPPVNFTPGQAVAVAVALSAPGPFAAEGVAALGKVLDAMGPAVRARTQALADRVWIKARPAAASSAWRQVEQSVAERRVVVVEYRDAQGQASRRRVEPHLLAFADGHWYLIGWCRNRDAVRWFRSDRIEQAHLTPESVAERDAAVFGVPPDDAFPVNLTQPGNPG